MILVLAADSDPHVERVTSILDARGAAYRRFDAQLYPAAATLSIRFDPKGAVRRTLDFGGERLRLEQVRAVWDRARTRPVAGNEVPLENRWAVSKSSNRVLSELWECLDCAWLPHRPSAIKERHGAEAGPPPDTSNTVQPFSSEPGLQQPAPGNKLHQLQLAGTLGFTVPDTLITNSPEDFLAFYDQCDGQVVFKLPVRTGLLRAGVPHWLFTTVVRRRAAASYRAIRHEPVVLQKRIPKKLELRVTVVGEQVFGAAIDSQAHSRLQVDWRHYPDFGGERYYSVYQLPPDVERRCIELVGALGLCFGAIDLILTPEGEYVFLEVNPNGQWGFVEMYTGLPIAEAIAGYLIRAAGQ